MLRSSSPPPPNIANCVYTDVYANIVAANSAVFFPPSEPSFPTVFVAWLNLDIGIDVCFFDGTPKPGFPSTLSL